MGKHWAVAQAFSGSEHLVRRDIEEAGFGAFVPTYARIWTVDGKPNAKEYPLLRGYVFFMTEPDEWGAVSDVEGVCGVLRDSAGNARRVAPSEMARLMLEHACGDHNEIGVSRAGRKRYRRPRPRKSKSVRKMLMAQ